MRRFGSCQPPAWHTRAVWAQPCDACANSSTNTDGTLNTKPWINKMTCHWGTALQPHWWTSGHSLQRRAAVVKLQNRSKRLEQKMFFKKCESGNLTLTLGCREILGCHPSLLGECWAIIMQVTSLGKPPWALRTSSTSWASLGRDHHFPTDLSACLKPLRRVGS